MTITGITISKTSLVLHNDHILELKANNIGIKDTGSKYILYYTPSPCLKEKPELQCYLKGLLSRIRSDQIYNAYNDDFGDHISGSPEKQKITIKKKVPLHRS